MKSVLIIRSNPIRPDSRVEKEAIALCENGYKVSILAWDRDANYKEKNEIVDINETKIPIIRVGIKAQFNAGFKNNFIPLLKFQYAIINHLKHNGRKYDYIHACDFDTAFAATIMRSAASYKLIYDVFDYYVDSFSVPGILQQLIERLDIWTINKADGVIICTEDREKQIAKATPKRLTVVHNSPDNTLCEYNDCLDSHSRIRIVYVGVLTPNRGILELCEYVSGHSEFELHIGGFGILENDVERYACRYDNIIFHGRIPYSETIKLESSSDILTAIYNPSIKNHVYAAPNKFYEALMLGKPLLMIKGSGMSDIVKKEQIGAVVPYDKISEGIETIVRQRHNWDLISEKEKELYNKFYSWEIMKERLLHFYETI